MLKPNMSFKRPPAARATTSSALIAAVARSALKEGAARVFVADHPVHNVDDVIEAMQLRPALEGLAVEIVRVGGPGPWVKRSIPRGKALTSAKFFKPALEADVHIAVPIAKCHSAAGFTGTMKGMMGLIRSRMPLHSRVDLHQGVVDLNTMLRPDLIIMDGLAVMTTGGPTGPGDIVRTDTLIAGTDPVAVDSAGVRLAPLYGKQAPPDKIKHLAIATASGLGRIDLPAERVHTIAM